MTTNGAATRSEGPNHPRNAWRLVRDGRLGPFLAGMVLSTLGVWVHNVAAAILAFELTGSSAAVGFVSVCQFLPQLVIGPWSGALADRNNRGRQLIVGRLLVALGAGVIGTWLSFGTGHEHTGYLVLVSGSTVAGLGFALGSPAMQALVPGFVHAAEVASASNLSTAPPLLARAVGPIIAGALVVGGYPQLAFGLAAMLNLAFAAIIAALTLPPIARDHVYGGSVRAGLRYVASHRRITFSLMGVGAFGFAADAPITLSPAIAEGLGDARLVGRLISAFGLGAALVIPFTGIIHRRFGLLRSASTGLLLMATAYFTLALTGAGSTAAVSLALAGAVMTVGLTAFTADIQQQTDDGMRGRVMALWMVAFVGVRPFASAIDGALADLFSPEVALVVVATLLVATAAASARTS